MQFPPDAKPAPFPRAPRPLIPHSAAKPPSGPGWIAEIKQDGWRLLAAWDGATLRLVSKQGKPLPEIMGTPLRPLCDPSRAWIIDGEIAVPDDRGVTHIGQLTDALHYRQADQLAAYVFDLVHLDGHDLSRCALVDRKAVLRDLVGRAPRLVYSDHVDGAEADQLLDQIRSVGGEGIVCKRARSRYRAGSSSDWVKIKCCEEIDLLVTGFMREAGRVVGLAVSDAQMRPQGIVRFGLARRRLGEMLDALGGADAPADGLVSVPPHLQATVRHFGRTQRGLVRDAYLVELELAP